MSALPSGTQRIVRIVEDALTHYSLDGDNIAAALEALRDLLDTDKVILYSFEQRPDTDDLRVAREATACVPDKSWRACFDEYLRGRGVAWGTYNAVSPELSQRDRVLDTGEITALTHGRHRGVEEVVYRQLGALGHDTMRVLVCDGPSLLAWVGIIQPQKTTRQQRELLQLVVPMFRKRLTFERFVSEAALASGAMDTAFEHVNGAAWLLGPNGNIEHANAAAQAQLASDRTATLATLAGCLAGTAEPRFTVTPVRGAMGSAGYVVVEAMARAAALGVPRAAVRLGLTPAQTRVLERVARGASNATIAAELKVAERTVEAHVTAILEKAQVPSRAALIVQIFA
jgi:DNA-binding CsgD family transcriptional regulator/PAS domain-containing protein